jgi:hypothetical protein
MSFFSSHVRVRDAVLLRMLFAAVFLGSRCGVDIGLYSSPRASRSVSAPSLLNGNRSLASGQARTHEPVFSQIRTRSSSAPTTNPTLIPSALPLRPQERRLLVLFNPTHKFSNLAIRRHSAFIEPTLFKPSHKLFLFLHTCAQPLVQSHWAERLKCILRLRKLGAMLLFQCAQRKQARL